MTSKIKERTYRITLAYVLTIKAREDIGEDALKDILATVVDDRIHWGEGVKAEDIVAAEIVPEPGTESNEAAWLNGKVAEYLAKKGVRCLFCGSEHGIEGQSVDIDAGGASQEVECKDCGGQWTDVYTLTDVDDVCQPDNETEESPDQDGEPNDYTCECGVQCEDEESLNLHQFDSHGSSDQDGDDWQQDDDQQAIDRR